jgi:hypothetical protein
VYVEALRRADPRQRSPAHYVQDEETEKVTKAQHRAIIIIMIIIIIICAFFEHIVDKVPKPLHNLLDWLTNSPATRDATLVPVRPIVPSGTSLSVTYELETNWHTE